MWRPSFPMIMASSASRSERIKSSQLLSERVFLRTSVASDFRELNSVAMADQSGRKLVENDWFLWRSEILLGAVIGVVEADANDLLGIVNDWRHLEAIKSNSTC